MNMRHPFSRLAFCRQWGITLIEAAIVLGVIGTVSGGIWVVASRVQRSVEITKLGEQMHQIVDNVRGLYANRAQISTDNTQAIVNGAPCGAANFNSRLSCLGVYPLDMVEGGVPGNEAHHRWWDGTAANARVRVVVRTIFYTNAPSQFFSVRMRDLPADVCTEMVSRYSMPDQQYGLKAILFLDNFNNVIASYVTTSRPPDWVGAGAGRQTLPITPAQASANCVAGLTAVEWIYGLR